MATIRRNDATRASADFGGRYGPWALVAGASEGLGAAYARALAQRGLHLVLVARRAPLLETLAADLRRESGVEVRCCAGDLSSAVFHEELEVACATLDVGLLVYNATHAPIGDFVSTEIEELALVVDVNVRAPVVLLRMFLPEMARRGRGGVILMTSLAGNQGTPRLAAYASSKAFNRILAESLWHELKDQGVDVVACCAGAVRTPGYLESSGKDAPGSLDPDQVVERTLRALDKGPVVIPGFVNNLAAAFMTRLAPRRTAISIMARSTRGLAASGKSSKGT